MEIRAAVPADLDVLVPLFDAYRVLGYRRDAESHHYVLDF
jgi:hypothetical protein